MNRTDAASWIVSVCACYLRLSQVKTLGDLVDAAMRCERISLANIGRSLLGTAKHQIKRCWRFCANQRVEPCQAMSGVIRKLVRKRKKPLVVAVDWTDIRGYWTLMASCVFKGRSTPLLWASVENGRFEKSRNAFEEGLLLKLREAVGEGVRILIVADRGFGRTELGRFCQRYRMHYVIRISPDVWVKSPEYTGKLLDYPVHKGICRVLGNVAYRQENPVRQNIVVRWKRGLPKHRDECWFLMTDLHRSAEKLSNLYGRRMTIEELFRDQKNKWNGWSLRHTQITKADRLDRLILIMALAYLLLCGIGLIARQILSPACWVSNSRKRACSVFTIGRKLIAKPKLLVVAAHRAFVAVLTASLEEVPNWG